MSSSRTAKEFAALEVITAANLNKQAGGWLGYAANSSNQTGITTLTDVNDATITVTVGTARLLKIEVTATVTVTGNSTEWYGTILEDGNVIGRWARTKGIADAHIQQFTGFAITTPTAGSHTYKAQACVTSASGSIEISGTAPAQAKLLVTDLGPAT